jgi:putative FmdB family regulatory protein
MPIYEYQCDRCNELFEIFHKIDEECKVACPKCLGPVKKLISATNFVLKGSGFYVNDYPSESRKEGKKKEKDGTKESSTSSTPSTPSTPSASSAKEGEKVSGKSEEKRAGKKAETK